MEKSEEKRYEISVIVKLSIDSDKFSFPTDDKGVLMWHPMSCINDYISHGLFKEHDASYMHYLDFSEIIQFEDWEVKYPLDLEKLLSKILIKNLWEHPETESGKKLHKDFETLNQALKIK